MSPSSYHKRTIIKREIQSEPLARTRSVRIFLPPGYNELVTYPVIYGQDGEQFFNFGRVATHATRLILDEGMEPVIIVGVDVDMENRTEEYSPSGSRFDRYCDFFVHELVPFVENQFPVRPDPEERILAGDSLGGTVSLHLALERPDLFRKVLSLSGAFTESTQERLREENDVSKLEIYMLIGEDETEVETDRGVFNFLHLNRVTRTMLEQRGARLRYVEKPGKHIWGFWQNELPEALLYFLGKRSRL